MLLEYYPISSEFIIDNLVLFDDPQDLPLLLLGKRVQIQLDAHLLHLLLEFLSLRSLLFEGFVAVVFSDEVAVQGGEAVLDAAECLADRVEDHIQLLTVFAEEYDGIEDSVDDTLG